MNNRAKFLGLTVASSMLVGCMTLKDVGKNEISPASIVEVKSSGDFQALTDGSLRNSFHLQLAGALLIKESDRICHKYLAELSTREKSIKSGLNITSLLLTAAATVTTPVESKDILTALATGSQGVENSLSNIVLGGVEADLIVQANRKGRKRQRVEIVNLLLGEGSETTAADSADFLRFLTEFETYHDSCGISYGRDVLKAALANTPADETPSATEVNTKEDYTESEDETAVDETAVDETAVDETAVDETAVDETAVDETAVDETAVDETAVDES